MPEPTVDRRLVQIQAGSTALEGILSLPDQARGMVIIVHGSGSSRNSPRNRFVADLLNTAGLATLLFDLLTPEEEQEDLQTRRLRFDVELLAHRTAGVILQRNPISHSPQIIAEGKNACGLHAAENSLFLRHFVTSFVIFLTL
jgi:predicted alpha/beta-hydrolase family hydrolase